MSIPRFRLPHHRSGLRFLLAVLLLLAALAAGCGKTAAPPAGQDAAPATPAGDAAGNAAPAPAQPDVILATTTSTQDSGLLDVLLPIFEQKTGYRVKTIAVGTGQALALAERGEADVVLVHAPEAEKKAVEAGHAVNRRLVMYNDFVLVGPPHDPAGVKSAAGTAEALRRIADAGALFISRGDDSGTHKKELALWQAAGITPGGTWYQETGAGMGQTLQVASEKGGYTLTDRGTFLATRQNLHLEILLAGDPQLLNIYHVMEVNPERFPKVNAAGARAFADFLLEPDTQEVIGRFGVDQYGEPLFFPAAGKTEDELLGSQQ